MIKIAIVGAGNITSLRHIPAFQRSGRVEILGVIDRKAEKARAVAERFSIPNSGSSFDEPWMKDAQAVSIGVPPHVHFETCRTALEQGKHVLMEKPMTLRVEEAEQLAALAKSQRLVFGVVQNFQFSRSAMALKRKIEKGSLGAITSLYCFQCSTTERRLPVWHEELPLGLFYDESPHLLYLLTAFSGGEVTVQDVTVIPSARGRVTPSLVTAHFRAGEIPAALYNNFEAPISEWHFIVYGTKAVGVIDLFRDILITIPNDGQHLAVDVLRSSLMLTGSHLWGVFTAGLRMFRGKHLYGNETVVQQFLDAIEFESPLKGISAEDGLRVLRLQHEMLRQARLLNGTQPAPAVMNS